MSDQLPFQLQAGKLAANVLARVLPTTYRIYMGFVAATSKVHRRGTEELDERVRAGLPAVAAILHQDCISAPFFFQDRGLCTLASKDGVGQIAAAVLERLGIEVVRGGSRDLAGRRLPIGLRTLIKYVIARPSGGVVAVVVPDGPHGPAGAIKPGLTAIAARTGAPIYCAKVHSRRARYLKNWDRTSIPFPFNEIWIDVIGPFWVPEKPDRHEVEASRRSVEQTLHKMHEKAFSRCGIRYPVPKLTPFETPERPAAKIDPRW